MSFNPVAIIQSKQYAYAVDMNKSIYGLNKEHISYSSWSLWKSSKEQYRKRYYEGEPSFETVETKFGHKVHEMLEKRDPSLQHIPCYKEFEHGIEVYIRGNKVIGRIDNFDSTRNRFSDFKTAHANKEGKAPWNKLKVRKLEQLPFYAMLLKEKYGRVERTCHLIWIETQFAEKTCEFDGHTLFAQSRDLRLTGKVKKFRRIVTKHDIRRIRKDLLKVCKEIKLDYEQYNTQRSQPVVLGHGKGETQEVPTV